MSEQRTLGFSALAIAAAATGVLAQTPIGNAFTYQGRLHATGMPAVSNADFEFALFDAEEDGSQVGATLSADDVALVDGLFTVSLDFGAGAFNGDARWIEVAVRSPAGAGGFTTLTPRQPLSAAPYALQTRGITVNENDLVGIGTTTPGKKLTVAGDMELGITSGDYRHLRIGGGNSDGFIYGSFPALGDGIHLGYNYFADAEGNDQVVHSGLGTSRITVGDGYVTLATGGTGFLPTNYLTLDRFGFVGIGTTTPSAELEVHGDILLGNGGQFFVPAGEEKLRLLRGNVDGDGTIDDGTGFSVTRLEEGIYRITFSEGFRGTPSLTVTPKRPFSDQNRAAHILGVNFDDATIDFRFSDGEHTDSDFSFCVIGRR